MSKCKIPADYHTLAQSRGFTWLGPKVPSVETRTTWRCEQGHEWEACYRNIWQGAGCHVCTNWQGYKTPANYHALAQSRGFKWLGPEVSSVDHKTGWQCTVGHRWQTKYTVIQRHGCPDCYRASRRKQPVDYHNLARSRGFKWLGPTVNRVCDKTAWRCGQGHEWQTSYQVIRDGGGCTICYQEARRKQPADYHTLAQQGGFKWLGPFPKNSTYKTTWQCSQGHEWQTSYQAIRQGKKCPHCVGLARKTAVDYERLAQQGGFRWLGPLPQNSTYKTGWQCDRGHIWYAPYSNLSRKPICRICRGGARRTDEAYHDLAEAMGQTWLGPNTPERTLSTNWMCFHWHHWTASYEELEAGARCPECGKESDVIAQTPAEAE